jgi:preprotein translocase subunit SecG
LIVLVTIVHVLMCIILILVVLLQTGKGADMGAAFGGSSQTVFGSGGPGTFLSKMTTVIAIIFMLTSLWLAYFASHKSSSVVDEAAPPPIEQTVPQTPAPTAPAPAPVPAVPPAETPAGQ